jgi:hypothetical protein
MLPTYDLTGSMVAALWRRHLRPNRKRRTQYHPAAAERQRRKAPETVVLCHLPRRIRYRPPSLGRQNLWVRITGFVASLLARMSVMVR